MKRIYMTERQLHDMTRSSLIAEQEALTANGVQRFVDCLTSAFSEGALPATEPVTVESLASALLPDYNEEDYRQVRCRETIEEMIGEMRMDGGGNILVERSVVIPDGVADMEAYFREKCLGRVGVCWSFVKGCAYNGEEGTEVVLKGAVAPESVDWKFSVMANGALPDEKELRLMEGSTVGLYSITFPDGRDVWSGHLLVKA